MGGGGRVGGVEGRGGGGTVRWEGAGDEGEGQRQTGRGEGEAEDRGGKERWEARWQRKIVNGRGVREGVGRIPRGEENDRVEKGGVERKG